MICAWRASWSITCRSAGHPPPGRRCLAPFGIPRSSAQVGRALRPGGDQASAGIVLENGHAAESLGLLGGSVARRSTTASAPSRGDAALSLALRNRSRPWRGPAAVRRPVEQDPQRSAAAAT